MRFEGLGELKKLSGVLIGGAPRIKLPPWSPDFVVSCNYWHMHRDFKPDVVFTSAGRSKDLHSMGDYLVVSKRDHVDVEKWFNRSFGLNPTMGLIAAKALLDLGCSLWLTGFDFYEWEERSGKKVHGSCVSRQVDVFTWLYEQYFRMEVDPHIYKLMKRRLIERAECLGSLQEKAGRQGR